MCSTPPETKSWTSLLRTATVDWGRGETIYIFDEGSRGEVDRTLSAALMKGHTVTRDHGVTQWVDVVPESTPEPSGYVWHEDGDRIRVEKTLFTKTLAGTMSQAVLHRRWMHYDTYWNKWA